MAFVRSKVVEGRTYYQLVHNYREAGKHRQKVLCHLGRHSSLELAIEEKTLEEEELRNKTAELFRETTEIKQDILDRYGEILGREIPSPEEAYAIEEKARKSFREYSREYWDTLTSGQLPEYQKLRHVFWQTLGLSEAVYSYHFKKMDAVWYDDRAYEAQEKKGKLMEFKEKYPHL